MKPALGSILPSIHIKRTISYEIYSFIPVFSESTFILFVICCCCIFFKILGKFTKLRKATVSFCLSAWNNTAPTRMILIKGGILVFSKICRENSIFIKIRQE